MIKGIGIDVESVSRIGTLVARYDQDTLQLIFTSQEICRCQHATFVAQCFTLCFAAKEALGKALGVGLATIDWNEIETKVEVNNVSLNLQGKALRRARSLDASEWLISWSTWEDQVVVTVIIQ